MTELGFRREFIERLDQDLSQNERTPEGLINFLMELTRERVEGITDDAFKDRRWEIQRKPAEYSKWAQALRETMDTYYERWFLDCVVSSVEKGKTNIFHTLPHALEKHDNTQKLSPTQRTALWEGRDHTYVGHRSY